MTSRWRLKSRGFTVCLCGICNSTQRSRAWAKRLRSRDVRHGARREIAEAME